MRRRRLCTACSGRFTTYEVVEVARLLVVKRDGRKEKYDKSKIELGLRRALEKRPVTEDKIQRVLSDVESVILSRHVPEIRSRDIGKIVLLCLRDVDEVAYLRFASVYQSFGSAESFRRAVLKIKDK